MPDAATLWVVLAATAVLVVLVVALLLAARGRRTTEEPAPTPEPFAAEPEDRPRAAVVVNPIKLSGGDATRGLVSRVCDELGWAEPMWLETTPEDPGAGQARAALDAGADVVVALGGDGTVRSVAQTMAGTGTAMGLLPAGTGNLLARNLAVDLTDVEGSLRAALTGDDRRVDVGWVTLTGGGAEPDADGDPAVGTASAEPVEHLFLVMAGMGFDAAMMADVPEGLKARVGPLAYFVSGFRHLRGRQARIEIAVDDAEPMQRRVSTVVIGNVGTLVGGLTLMPDAEVDDGWLDGVTIAPRGIVGWAGVAAQVITRRRKGHARVEHWRGRQVTITADRPEEAQLDGDPVGTAVALGVRVDPGALLLRVPAGTPPRA